MQADSKVLGAAVRVAINRSRAMGLGWSKTDARGAATRLLETLPPFPPDAPDRVARWDDFGNGLLARCALSFAPADGFPAACACLSSQQAAALARAVLEAAWEAEAALRRESRVSGRPEEALLRRGGGWIRPDGELLAGGPLEHLGTLRADGFAPDRFARLDELVERAAEDKEDFLSAFGEDDHVPWHAYHTEAETERDEIRGGLVVRAYGEGWVRLALHRRPGEKHRTLSAEGSRKGLDLARARLDEIAERCDAVADERVWAFGRRPAL